MIKYQYRAKDINGTVVRGQVLAEEDQQAYEEIRNAGLFVVSLRRISEKTRIRPLNARNLADFSKQMATMLESGISLIQAMNMLVQRERDPKLTQVYRNVYHLLLQGYVLSQAMDKQSDLFPPLVISMVRAGEEVGQMTASMQELAVYYEKDDKMRKRIESAMVYPVFLGCVIIVSLIFLFTTILPSFFQLFQEETYLPASTRSLMWLSDHLVTHGYLILAAVVAISVFLVYLSQKTVVQLYISRLLLELPVIGSLLSSIYTARFARTLSTLYAQGIPLIQGVRLTIDVMGNSFLEKQLKVVLQDLCGGVPLSGGIAGVIGLHSRLADSIFIGEETGELQTLLEHVADSFDTEAEEASKRMTTLIEPVMIVVMAVIVGFIMISVMTPLLQYYDTLG